MPPKSAGNRGDVTQYLTLSANGQTARRGRRRRGGMYFYGLCRACNGLQAPYDDAYTDLARHLWPVASNEILLLSPLQMPRHPVRPAAIARSVLISCFALNPVLQDLQPALAESLRTGQPATLPDGLRLHLALTRGPQARATGSIGGFYLFRPKRFGRNLGLMTLAQVYFPPLAWQLADPDESPLLKHEGWVDVSSWVERDVETTVCLQSLTASLPIVRPHMVSNDDDWTELLGDESCFVVESDNALPSVWG